MMKAYWDMRYIVFNCVCNFIESCLNTDMYYKYLVICVILIILPTIMAPKSVPTTLCPMMTPTCVIAGNAVLIAEGWFTKHDARH